jgi:hypothetical protein
MRPLAQRLAAMLPGGSRNATLIVPHLPSHVNSARPCEQDPLQFSGAIQQCGVVQFVSPVFIGRDHIDTLQAEPRGDGTRNMVIHVPRDGHQMSPLARNLASRDVGLG